MPGYEQGSRIIGKAGNLLEVTPSGGIPTELRGMAEKCKATRVTVRSGPTLLPPSPLPQRKSIGIYVPSSGSTIYVGGSDVTTDQGFPVNAGQYLFLDAERGVYAISSTNVDIRVIEGS